MYGVSSLVSFDLKQGTGQVIYLYGHAWRHTDKIWHEYHLTNTLLEVKDN